MEHLKKELQQKGDIGLVAEVCSLLLLLFMFFFVKCIFCSDLIREFVKWMCVFLSLLSSNPSVTLLVLLR